MGCGTCMCKWGHDESYLEVNQNNNDQNTLKNKKNSNDSIINENLNEKMLNSENTIYRNEFDHNFIKTKLIQQINIYRAKHHSEPLIFDKNISIISQNHAEKIAREENIELSLNEYQGEELGEIIFSCINDISPKELVNIWYLKDSTNYNYSNPNPNPSNFTQLIWKNSKYIGIGYSKTKNDVIYLVLNFYPSGNINGQFIENVLPPDADFVITKSEKDSISRKSEIFSVNSDEIVNFYEEALIAHNEYRDQHGVPALILNPILSTIAFNHALEICKKNEMFHSNNLYQNEKCGENLCIVESDNGINGKEITKYWYNGIHEYNFKDENDKNNENDNVQNFTQLIWKDTKEVGFGYIKKDTDKNKKIYYIVANYFPCGNIKGQYKQNVLPKIE